jgi:hypothetical protein
MKKLFVAVLAVAALASCAQEDVILNNDKAITFGDAYVQNSTKAIYEGSEEVDAFQVWGTVTPVGGSALPLYEGANVTRPAGLTGYDPETAWTCDVQRFWTPNCEYAFYAVVDSSVEAGDDGKIAPNANVTAQNGVPTSIAYTADGQNDLLYAATTKNVGADASNPGFVVFAMQHLLSKVSFKFTNTNTNADYTYQVTKVVVSGAWRDGAYTFANTAKANANDGTWARTGGETMADLSFLNGNTALTLANATVSGDNVTASTTVAPKSFVIIPGTPALSIAITVETLLNDTTIYSKDYTLKVNQTGGTDKTFEKNIHYNLVVALEGGKPIDFTIGSVGDFSTPAGNDVTIQ